MEPEIRSLERLSAADLRRVGPGYVSQQVYRVTKEESHKHTAIRLELTNLDTPYQKTFEHSKGLLSYYRSAVRKGLSLGAFDGDTLVGIAIADAQVWNGTLLLWEFHVAAAYRRLGIGRRMMDALAHRAQQAGLRVITVETQSTNVPAITFYRRVGFTIEGIDLSFYTNDDLAKGEVAIFMKRRLGGFS
jgi:ribosomal protein S18 acetylase RimI-like enzyme